MIILPCSASPQLKQDFIAKKTNNEKQATSKDSAKIWNNITFLNAANFDFSDNIKGSYLGKLNIFAPDIKNSPWGLIAGIMRIKFGYKDSSNAPIYLENRLIHPLDSIKQGLKYLREINQYVTVRSNTVWSFYIQPTFRIISWPWTKDKDNNSNHKRTYAPNAILPNGIYLHIHAELLVNSTDISTSVTNIQRDTSLIDTSKHLSYIAYQKNPLIFDKTYLNGYFGIGLTFSLDPFGNGNSRFFFQATVGKTTNYPNWTSQDISSTVVNVVPTRSGTTIQEGYRVVKSGRFYLVRTEFTQMLSDNSQIIVGTDIRGLFPRYNPVYAAYIGLNINLDALAKIVSDKGKTATPSTKPTESTE